MCPDAVFPLGAHSDARAHTPRPQVPTAAANRVRNNADNLTSLLPGPYPYQADAKPVTSPGGTNAASGFNPSLRTAGEIHADLKASHITFAGDRSPGARFSRKPLSGTELADPRHASVRTSHVNVSQWGLGDMEAAGASTAADTADVAARQRRAANYGGGAGPAVGAAARGGATASDSGSRRDYEEGAKTAARRVADTFSSSFQLG